MTTETQVNNTSPARFIQCIDNAPTVVTTSTYPTDATLANSVRDRQSDATLGANHRMTDDPILFDKTVFESAAPGYSRNDGISRRPIKTARCVQSVPVVLLCDLRQPFK